MRFEITAPSGSQYVEHAIRGLTNEPEQHKLGEKWQPPSVQT